MNPAEFQSKFEKDWAKSQERCHSIIDDLLKSMARQKETDQLMRDFRTLLKTGREEANDDNGKWELILDCADEWCNILNRIDYLLGCVNNG